MATNTPHNRSYRPPFPALKIMLRSPGDGQSSGDILALLDTGADITSVPIRYLERIQAPEVDEVRLRSHWGHAVNVITYLVDIVIDNATLPAIEVASDTMNSEIVLGRDVLNHLILLIDGPLHNTTVLEKRPRAI